MKTTKIVEIEVCDRCHREQTGRLRPCIKCGGEICNQCDAHFNIEVRRVTPHFGDVLIGCPLRPVMSRSVKYETVLSAKHVTYTANYCVDCGVEIEKALIECGFIPEAKSPPPSVIMDAA